MDENDNKDGENKMEYGLKDSDFAESNTKSEENENLPVATGISSENDAVSEKSDVIPTYKKGFLTLPIKNIFDDFFKECQLLLKDSGWLLKSVLGFFVINALTTLGSLRVRSMTMAAMGTHSSKLPLLLMTLAVFVIVMIVSAGLANVVYQKIFHKKDVSILSFDTNVSKLLKKTFILILVMVSVIFLCSILFAVVFALLLGPAFSAIVSGILCMLVAIYTLVRLVLYLPSAVNDEDFGIKNAFAATSGYGSSLFVTLLLYGIAYALLNALFVKGVSYIKIEHVNMLVLVVSIIVSAVNQILAMVLSATIYKFFKKNNLLSK